MKLTTLEIGEFLRFNNVKFDFTYPPGHPKAGRPLHKVCFIGQSGTGKTSLLNLIKNIVGYGLIESDYDLKLIQKVDGRLTSNGGITKKVYFVDGAAHVGMRIIGKERTIEDRTEHPQSRLIPHYRDSNVLIHFPAEINTSLEFNTYQPPQNLSEAIRPAQQAEEDGLNYTKDQPVFQHFDFSAKNVGKIWADILKEIHAYRTAQLAFVSQLTNKLSQQLISAEKLLLELQDWQKNNENQLIPLSKHLNRILHRFNLEIRPEFEFKNESDLHFINIHQRNGDEVPFHFWSTGTKQVIFTATPLFTLNTDKTVVLMDEPERSLYPDIQEMIIDYYSECAPNAQFFYATHSPIIASSFDPWEIYELKFDEKGNVYVESYLKPGTERHVDNYKLHPKYLRWDSILQKVFDLETEGHKDRQAKMGELARLDQKLVKLREKSGAENTKEIQELWVKYKELAEQLDWKIQENYAEN